MLWKELLDFDLGEPFDGVAPVEIKLNNITYRIDKFEKCKDGKWRLIVDASSAWRYLDEEG